ncbi:hypothetical protein CERZMDRAFT_116501 [Cercospora zeae-maydis SCOH1-5]|uniref:Uncharacterized protein n=1 Tax=Cercospora zeae-maydis SCOH1-5 TaxID=717836 RepID=A0A6A6FQE0_9PEZI|nr:hypothetical protein CERZMDRAFT_116501 [Cercospora zeae-maydis SCOH1-5]
MMNAQRSHGWLYMVGRLSCSERRCSAPMRPHVLMNLAARPLSCARQRAKSSTQDQRD